MSIQPGLISPPLSGRTYKADEPRLGDKHLAASAADVFGRPPAHNVRGNAFDHHLHPIRSPEKKRKDDLAGVPGAVRPPTPPMSRDVRHDEELHNHHDDALRHRASSEGDHWDAPPSSVARAPCTAAAPADRFGTLTQGVSFESDDEQNASHDRQARRASPSSSSEASKAVESAAPPAHASAAQHDEYDSGQDAEGSVHDEDEYSFSTSADATPRRSCALADRAGYRPARPLSDHVRVDNEELTWVVPIRDTPMNPFLAGGPADNGFNGPRGFEARRRAQQVPGKERGKITYVFRGQKVTYADPEYDSDEDDSSDDDVRARTNAFNPHHKPNRPPRLQPKLLFPASTASSSTAEASGSSHAGCTRASGGAPTSRSSTSYLPFADLGESDGEREAPRQGGGLFAAQIAAKHRPTSVRSRAEAPTRTQPSKVGGQTAREALLARLDHTNWSDDDDDEGEGEDGQRGVHRRYARDSSHETGEEDEVEVESHLAPRAAGAAKRGSDELQRGHQDALDDMGRPLKRSRASYAY